MPEVSVDGRAALDFLRGAGDVDGCREQLIVASPEEAILLVIPELQLLQFHRLLP